jgi:hypothetical protein
VRLFSDAIFFIALLAVALPVRAMPPFSYESALKWSDETVKSAIPEAQRIYVLGPEKITETYQLDAKPAKHDVEVRRAVAMKLGLTLGQALTQFSFDRSKPIQISLYRQGPSDGANASTPYFTMKGRLPSSSTVGLKPRDVILISYVPPPGEKPQPNL